MALYLSCIDKNTNVVKPRFVLYFHICPVEIYFAYADDYYSGSIVNSASTFPVVNLAADGVSLYEITTNTDNDLNDDQKKYLGDMLSASMEIIPVLSADAVESITLFNCRNYSPTFYNEKP